jgi:hypothetical protein
MTLAVRVTTNPHFAEYGPICHFFGVNFFGAYSDSSNAAPALLCTQPPAIPWQSQGVAQLLGQLMAALPTQLPKAVAAAVAAAAAAPHAADNGDGGAAAAMPSEASLAVDVTALQKALLISLAPVQEQVAGLQKVRGSCGRVGLCCHARPHSTMP